MLKSVVTITPLGVESMRRLKDWLARVHGPGVAFDDALRSEIQTWLQDGSGAELAVEVKVAEIG